ncbi:hypothetical protein OFM04_32510, partial [Escherichia coli]|nr:hypothetical protein [Escherichia coli]
TEILLGGPEIPVTLNVTSKGVPPAVGQVPVPLSGIGPTPLPGNVTCEKPMPAKKEKQAKSKDEILSVLLNIL